MCGIAGLFLKSRELEPELGRLTSRMLSELGARGPDSTGFAVYGAIQPGVTKVCAVARKGAVAWAEIAARLSKAIATEVTVQELRDHAVFRINGDGESARRWLIDNVPEAIV